MTISALTDPFTKTSAALAAILAMGLIAAQPAAAGSAAPPGWTRSSVVTDNVTDNGNGTWTYAYTVSNTSQENGGPELLQPILVDWELPWFGDAGIDTGSIASPTNWAWSIEDIGFANSTTGWEGVAAWQTPGDPFYAGPGSPFTAVTQVLHWYNTCWAGTSAAFTAAAVGSCATQFQNAIFPGLSLSDFGFVAAYDEAPAPYQASWASLPVRTGDPAFPLGGPNSPGAQGAQGPQGVPEPGVLGLLGAGLAALLLGRRRRG